MTDIGLVDRFKQAIHPGSKRASTIWSLCQPTASSVPQPMDLDRTHPVKRDPHHGLCFNCGKPGHITKVCRGLHAQNVQNVDATMIPRLTPEDLQFLVESLRATVTPSVPTMPPPESEGKKTPGDEGFKAATGEACAPVASCNYFGL